MSAYKNTVTNLLTAIFLVSPCKLPGDSQKRAAKALRNSSDPIFVRAHINMALRLNLFSMILMRSDDSFVGEGILHA